MKLIRLKVEHFRCIRKAQLDFGAGLNVLHGPNDLGKSSLAAAIRAALLLQVTSREAQGFDCWHGGGDAQVELTFETGPQRFWRVEKTFGNHAQTRLYESRDGVDFHKEADGRAVDGKLSEILRWGIAAPGGKGRSVGMPVTFLSSALMAKQDEVSKIFDQALSGDGEESGKKWLIEVLQAVAEDPLFKSVLQLVQGKVMEAFSSSGQRKRGKDSPWIKIQEQMKRAEAEERDCSEQLNKTEAIEGELRALLNQRLGMEEALRRHGGELRVAQEGYDQARARQVVLGRVEESKRRLGGITAALEKLADTKRRRGELERAAATLVGAAENSKAKLANTAEQFSLLTEGLRAKLADHERERQLRRSTLEKNVAELSLQQTGNEAAVGQVRAFEALIAKAQKLEVEAHGLTEKIATQTRRHEDSSKALWELDGVSQLITRKLATGAISEAEKGLTQIQKWRREADGYRTAAGVLEKTLEEVKLPGISEITALKQLETQLQVARAKLGVGLQISLKPKRDLNVVMSRDGSDAVRSVITDGVMNAQASSQIRLEIEGVAEISFSGGDDRARAEAARLQEQWSRQAEPVLRRTGLGSADEIAEAARRYATSVEAIRKLQSDAAVLEQRIRDQRDWAAMRIERQRELDAANEALQGFDISALEKAAVALGMSDATAEASFNRVRLMRPKLMANERLEESALTTAKAQIVEKQSALAGAKAEVEAARSATQGYSEVLLAELLNKKSEVSDALRRAEKELVGISTGDDAGLVALRSEVEAARQNHVAAEALHLGMMERWQDTKGQLASVEGELKILEEAAVKLDEGAARLELRGIEAELALMPEPKFAVMEESLAELQAGVKSLRDELADVEGSIQAKRGALEQVGGQVAKERMESAQEALIQLRDQERDVENDYAAWALLRETLLEAEQQEGVHLGRVLGGPIVKRFGELTNGRYGKFTLGPDLETNTISVAGEGRAVDALSVGTRDQLAIIFRLTLAELLQSAVVLDDQLTQSDGQRMSWISDFIRQMAKNIQIVVFTCRAGDYLQPAELKAVKKSDYFNSAVRSVDLTQVIESSQRIN